MSGVNKCIILGRLGKNPELKQVNGTALAKFSLATSETWTDKDGEKQERTEWHNCNAWGKQAEVICKYLSKGDQLYIEGSLETRSWEDDDGNKRYATDIKVYKFEFVGGKREGNDANSNTGGF